MRMGMEEYGQLWRTSGGEGGIRTPDTLSSMPVFKTGAINRSATSPLLDGLLDYTSNDELAEFSTLSISSERVNDFETGGVRVSCRTGWLSGGNGG